MNKTLFHWISFSPSRSHTNMETRMRSNRPYPHQRIPLHIALPARDPLRPVHLQSRWMQHCQTMHALFDSGHCDHVDIGHFIDSLLITPTFVHKQYIHASISHLFSTTFELSDLEVLAPDVDCCCCKVCMFSNFCFFL